MLNLRLNKSNTKLLPENQDLFARMGKRGAVEINYQYCFQDLFTRIGKRGAVEINYHDLLYQES